MPNLEKAIDTKPEMAKVIDTKPSLNKAIDIKSQMAMAKDTKSQMNKAIDTKSEMVKVYGETQSYSRTINAGMPIGLLLALTYPTDETFTVWEGV